MRKSIGIVIGLIAAGALAGCSSSGKAAVGQPTVAPGAIATTVQTVTAPPVTVTVKAKVPKTTQAASKPTAAKEAKKADGTYSFGSTVAVEGDKLTLGTPVRFYPSEYAMIDPEMSGARYYKIPVSMTNGTSKSVNPGDLVLDATSGTTSVNGVYDSPIGDEPTADILPGRTVAWVEGYQVRPGTHLTIEVSDMASFTGDPVTFDGVIH